LRESSEQAFFKEERMKKLSVSGLIALVAVTLLFVPGCVTTPEEGSEADVERIRVIWNIYSTARVVGDYEVWLSLWDEEGIQMPPGAPARSKDVLDEVVPKAFTSGSVSSMNIYPEEIVVAGSWAYARGTYDSEREVEGKAVRVEGKFLTIFKRQPDGTWRIYRDCFNSNVP
jgi:ketosteroid isomerase-like protein